MPIGVHSTSEQSISAVSRTVFPAAPPIEPSVTLFANATSSSAVPISTVSESASDSAVVSSVDSADVSASVSAAEDSADEAEPVSLLPVSPHAQTERPAVRARVSASNYFIVIPPKRILYIN